MDKSTFAMNIVISIFLLLIASVAYAHGVDDNTKQFLQNNEGLAIAPYMYIGAKHMITGYDHLLFLIGVIFLLYRTKEILLYVSLFTLGHSVTLLFGVLDNINFNPFLIDAIIGFSVVYKGFDNLGGFKRLLGFQPSTKLAVLVFGLIHGFGLATKIQEFDIPADGLVGNLIAFNVGVELGQFIALFLVVLALNFWRKFSSYLRLATVTNTLLMSCGFALVGFQLTGYFLVS